VEALREYVTIARLRYDEGYASYLEVIYAENLLYEAQVRRMQVQGRLLQAMANLYKAMGIGG
jgi:outer membrane protein, multidrug efflux system